MLRDRSFGLILSGILGGLFVASWILTDTRPWWAALLAAALLAVALARPVLLLPLNRLWHRLAHVLGTVNTRALMALFFFLIIFPVAAILRMFGRDPMQRAIDPTIDTYWRSVSRGHSAETLRDLF
jgi:MFS family permease